MESVRGSVRLTGRDLFVYYIRGVSGSENKVHGGICTNKRVLSERTGIDYNTLMWNFTRKGYSFYDNGDIVVMKFRPSDIVKGGQSLSRKGKGGMERFKNFVIGKSRDY